MATPTNQSDAVVGEVLELFRQRGASQYGGEAVTQVEHALQAATFAECDGATPSLIVAALLHDVGHLLHDLPDDAPNQGVDDRHETLAASWLSQRFGPAVAAPAAMHVAAKRYLCAVDREYLQRLSEPSIQSLGLQGGSMTPQEASQFQQRPHFQDAVQLRRWDDAAKIVGMATRDLEHFVRYLDLALEANT